MTWVLGSVIFVVGVVVGLALPHVINLAAVYAERQKDRARK